MRTLVDQTKEEIAKWLGNLENAGLIKNSYEGGKPRVVVLMGGETPDGDEKDWDLYPEQNCILIGTQDMLLSRALNRGYGMSRYRWPMRFGLLNNDALWVLDEVQLMGVGVETCTQMQAFREILGTAQGTATWWASATLNKARLTTVDFKPYSQSLARFSLEEPDRELNEAVKRRLNSLKRLEFTHLALALAAEKADAAKTYIKELARKVAAVHKDETLTLVVLNRVQRAQSLYSELKLLLKDSEVHLIHSRFRPSDRGVPMASLKAPNAKGIFISTQAIEAGLDVSARVLFTEIAPWSSLVQRFGRCNRDGNQPDGGFVYWMDLHSDDAKTAEALALPYTHSSLNTARETLKMLAEVGPSVVSNLQVKEEKTNYPVIRRKDLLDLFDTTPDLAGYDLDISRYIRDGEDSDVQVFWRSIEDLQIGPDTSEPQPDRNELCRVSVFAFRKFLESARKKLGKPFAWRWNALEGVWEKAERPFSGQTYLLAEAAGGYSEALGWTGDITDKVNPLSTAAQLSFEEDASDFSSTLGKDETLTEHTRNVELHTERITETLHLARPIAKALELAARWHDIGKAHYHFQKMLRKGETTPPAKGTDYLAKSADKNGPRCTRAHFRHELASALAWLDSPDYPHAEEADLIAYLIASHHGKVRLSIRAVPTEKAPENEPSRLYARGVWHEDQIPFEGWPLIELSGRELPRFRLDLSIMQMGDTQDGRPSWLTRTLTLRDRADIGPFRLALLETILRAADGVASKI